MTEITDKNDSATAKIELTPPMRDFILHWGEMGTRWGINRTVAQVHALLYLAPQPLDAECIAATLNVARSNVSTSLKELQNWGIVRIVPVLGNRRDHFATFEDVWAMYQIILDERKKREIDPTIELIRRCVDDIDKSRRKTEQDKRVHERLSAMLDYLETMSSWYTQIRNLPQAATIKFAKMGRKITKLLGVV